MGPIGHGCTVTLCVPRLHIGPPKERSCSSLGHHGSIPEGPRRAPDPLRHTTERPGGRRDGTLSTLVAARSVNRPSEADSARSTRACEVERSVSSQSPETSEVGPVAMTVRSVRPTRGVAVGLSVLLFGLAVTAGLTLAMRSNNLNTERRLLRVQAAQAGEVLRAAIPSTTAPLQSAALVYGATRNVAGFTAYLRPLVGPTGAFDDVQLWAVRGGRVAGLASVSRGGRPALRPGSAIALAFARTVMDHPTFVVQLDRGAPERLLYGFRAAGLPSGDVIYAERALPADRQSKVAETSAAFAELRYAIYLGEVPDAAHLLTTDFPSGRIAGTTAVVRVPFGDTVLTLVAAPATSLAGALSDDLPWALAAIGTLLSVAAAFASRQMVHRRRLAEVDAARSRRLSTELGHLYAEQRSIAETLQRSFLPLRIPAIEGIEIAVRYVAGAPGSQVGGDWYSIVAIDEDHFGFVIGDVSGHGIQSATVMAALRFTIRTLVLEGLSPEVVLQRCASHVTELLRGHFATVLVGVGDLTRHEVTVANAGHLSPLLLGETAAYVQTALGPPIGVVDHTYETTTFATPPGALLLAFTDGLVERRHESLDVGLERLRASALRAGDATPSSVLTTILADLAHRDVEDDVALLAIRWTAPGGSTASAG